MWARAPAHQERHPVTAKLYSGQFGSAAAAMDQAPETLDCEHLDMMLLHHPDREDVKIHRAGKSISAQLPGT